MAEADPRIRLHMRDIPDDEAQIYFKASDIMVFPYDNTLNSGAAMAALTFGLPIIGSNTVAFKILPSDFVTTFDHHREGALGEAMQHAHREKRRPERNPSQTQRMGSFHPHQISQKFFSALEELIC